MIFNYNLVIAYYNLVIIHDNFNAVEHLLNIYKFGRNKSVRYLFGLRLLIKKKGPRQKPETLEYTWCRRRESNPHEFNLAGF